MHFFRYNIQFIEGKDHIDFNGIVLAKDVSDAIYHVNVACNKNSVPISGVSIIPLTELSENVIHLSRKTSDIIEREAGYQ